MGTGERPGTVVVVLEDGAELAVARLDGMPAGLGLVDLLARLQLAAGRLGCSVVVRDPSPELCELLDLAGLAGVIATSCRSALQAGREAEELEQLGVQEVLPGGDPPA